MQVYLPIAESSVDLLTLVGIGGSVGLISGLFGVGGGFLLTPLLFLFGIPHPVAVATGTCQVVGSSFSAMLTHWKRRAVDIRMGGVLLVGGVIGSMIGVWLFGKLQALGQIDLFVSVAYVILLTSVGGLMLLEGLRTGRKRPRPVKAGRKKRRPFIKRLPLRITFAKSQMVVSIVPPLMIGFLIGLLAALLGVGGGFIMVPAMIYLLKMPTRIVVGTSLFQIVFVAAVSTILHAWNNQSVDILLALILLVGAVLGAQIGTRLGTSLKAEQMRSLLALVVLAVAARLLFGLVVEPAEAFSIVEGVS